MTARLLDGEALAARRLAGLAPRIRRLVAEGVLPRLVTVLVGDDPASGAYIARKHRDCAALGIASDDIRRPTETTAPDLLRLISDLNADDDVHGVLVQLPLPAHLDAVAIGAAVDPSKDVDGLHPANLGLLLAGVPDILPCTPAAVLALLRHHDVALAGRRVAILGRGTLVGRPLAMLLSLPGIDAEVTMLHSRSPDIGAVTRAADVIVSAIGVPDQVTAAMVAEGAAVVGVGISYDSAGAMVSDIAADVAGKAGHVTPPHGSVGAMTRACLMENLVDLAERPARRAVGARA